MLVTVKLSCLFRQLNLTHKVYRQNSVLSGHNSEITTIGQTHHIPPLTRFSTYVPMVTMKWKTRFTKSFPCRVPIMGAPMADTSGGLLAAETCRAGGLGFVAAGHLNSKEALIKLEREINIFRQADTEDCYPLAIGFIGHSTFGSEDGWRMFENILEDYQPQVIQCFAPAISYHKEQKNKKNVVQIAHSYGCKIIAQVGTVEEGIQALEAGVDAIIAQGSEAGGHGVRREDGNGTLSLTARLVKIAAAQKKRVPVLAAGGISDGRGLIAALSLGADGVVLGTRLWASVEAMGPASFKAALLEASSGDDVVRTRVFDTINNSYKGTKWPAPYDSSGTLRNETTKTWDGRLHEVEALLKTGDESDGVHDFVSYKQAVKEEDANLASVYCGEGVGEINSIDPAFAIIQRIEKEALKILQNLQTIVVEDNAEDEDTAEF